MLNPKPLPFVIVIWFSVQGNRLLLESELILILKQRDDRRHLRTFDIPKISILRVLKVDIAKGMGDDFV